MDEATKLPIGPEEVAEAAQILQRYKAGKAALDGWGLPSIMGFW